MNDPSRVDYDSALVDVSPRTMQQTAKELDALRTEVSDCLGAIDDRLQSLRLSWTGNASRERQKITEDWQHVITGLFGQRHQPDTGVLNALVGGVADAAGNFAKADLGVTDVFRRFANGLESDGKPTYTDKTTHTAVTADYPD
ncbi:WXG100 family type VII secretion target [Streptomyces sp. NPDC054786]